MVNIEQMIQNKACELGYESCGIVPLEKLSEYGQKMLERIQTVPQSEKFYQSLNRLIDPREAFSWAQSVVVVIERYGKYAVPDEIKGYIGKQFLFDTRIDENTEEFQAGLKMENYMRTLGLQFVNERKFGLVGLRWAAMKAGLGIIRRNNFFYTEKSGSWVSLQGWLIDKKLELIETTDLPKCSNNCNRCIKACPSGSLSAPYTMSPAECVSYLTTFGGHDLPDEPLRKTFSQCLYGCDICQEICPMNKGKWDEIDDFPGVSELAPYLTPENIMEMDDDFYKQNIQPKFFYLNPEDLWKWKVSVLCFMNNNYQENYKSYIIAACKNENKKIREMAELICSELINK
ncbi:MAG: epoxyqueuosine reductase [Desulfosporosinus sp.]|nr:epoxyqueuosine reductase [Desulfosporosinus sp.]